jgi:hypothetical protein
MHYRWPVVDIPTFVGRQSRIAVSKPCYRCGTARIRYLLCSSKNFTDLGTRDPGIGDLLDEEDIPTYGELAEAMRDNALAAVTAVVLVELGVIPRLRHGYMERPCCSLLCRMPWRHSGLCHGRGHWQFRDWQKFDPS